MQIKLNVRLAEFESQLLPIEVCYTCDMTAKRTENVHYGSSHVLGMKGSLWLLLLCYLTRPTIATPNCEGSNTDIQLCSSINLSQNSFVCPGQSLTFTCTTNGSPILAWSSSQYVGSPLFFSSEDMVGTSRPSHNGASIGNLTNHTNLTNLDSNSTVIILESQLHFEVSDEYNSSQIICSNIASGMNVNIIFNVDLQRTSADCRTISTTAPATTTTSGPTSVSLSTRELLTIVLPTVIGGVILIIFVGVCIGITVYCCCCREKTNKVY